HEAEMISARTVAALAAAKARGVRLGNPNLRPGCRGDARKAARTRRDLADRHAEDVRLYLDQARRAGCRSLGELADALTARGRRLDRAGHTHAGRQHQLGARTGASDFTTDRKAER